MNHSKKKMNNWCHIQNIEDIDSPSIVLYEDRMMYNLNQMIALVNGDTSKLMPHIKTNKMPKVVGRMILLGIKNFKASTIAEAEMAGRVGADAVLIAHQLVGPKIQRLASLIRQLPKTEFSTIVDNPYTLKTLQEESIKNNIQIGVYIDVNNGMDRSGVKMGDAMQRLLEELPLYKSLKFLGLHVYDGHLRDPDFKQRKQKVEHGMKSVRTLFNDLKHTYPDLQLVCGGTPTFTAHLKEKDRVCSPGTCVFWDWGYGETLSEQDFKYAVLLITRVISKPTKGIVTIDLGHKAVASENPIDKRIKFLNLDSYKLLSQSEEHGVLQVEDWGNINVGDVFYGIPYHICPTVNLYDEAALIKHGKMVEYWDITARKRKITV